MPHRRKRTNCCPIAVTQLPVGSPQCANGGALIQTGCPPAFAVVCNGANGQPGFAGPWIQVGGPGGIIEAIDPTASVQAAGGTVPSVPKAQQNVAFGTGNSASGGSAACIGGSSNTVTAPNSVCLGGVDNTVSGPLSACIGGGGNQVLGNNVACIACGAPPFNVTTVRGTATAVIASYGSTTTAAATNAGIFAGNGNTVTANFAATLGGAGVTASAKGAVCAGGGGNMASGVFSACVGGGASSGPGNVASGAGAVTVGGTSNLAGGASAVAAGQTAQANSDNTFVWGDGSNTVTDTGARSFTVLATGGPVAGSKCVTFYTNIDQKTGVYLIEGASSWAGVSDVNTKENIAALNCDDVLTRVERLPLYSYNFRGNASDRVCLGPMAHEWHALFPSSKDQHGIEGMDLDGAALASVKGLAALVRQQTAQLNEQAAQIRELEKLVLEKAHTCAVVG